MAKICSNLDCDNSELYSNDTYLEFCPECGTELNDFDELDYMDEEEETEEEEEENEIEND